MCLFLKENGKLQLLIFFLTLVDFSIASIRLIFPRRVNTRLFIVSIWLFDSPLRNLPPYFSISKLNELDLVSYYIYLFLEPIRKLWRILNSTMSRIHLYMCSFLVSFVLCSSSSTTSKYLTWTINLTVHCAFEHIIIIIFRRNLVLFWLFKRRFYFNLSIGHSLYEFMFFWSITSSKLNEFILTSCGIISCPEVTQ